MIRCYCFGSFILASHVCWLSTAADDTLSYCLEWRTTASVKFVGCQESQGFPMLLPSKVVSRRILDRSYGANLIEDVAITLIPL